MKPIWVVKRKTNDSHKKLRAGRGAVGKTAVMGVKDRETGKVKVQVVYDTSAATLQDFVIDTTNDDTVVYTDEARAYIELPRSHKAIKHSVESMLAVWRIQTA